MPRKTPFLIEKDYALIDCYRFSIKMDKSGCIRIYAFNERAKGDVEIRINGGEITLYWEYARKAKKLLEKRVKEFFLSQVFEGRERDVEG